MSDLTADQVMSNLHPSTQNKLLDRITELEAERDALRAALIEVERITSKYRIWDGMGLTYHHAPAFRVERIVKLCTAALAATDRIREAMDKEEQ